MPGTTDSLLFQESPVVEYASNIFINVPVILQYDDTPLIEVVNVVEAGYTTQFSIYNRDGVYIAKVKGSRLFTTDEGKKSNLQLRYPEGATVCCLDGHTLFEIRRKEAAALKTEAELYSPDGRFIRSNSSGFPEALVTASGDSLRIGGFVMMNSTIKCREVGIRIQRNGSIGIGRGCP